MKNIIRRLYHILFGNRFLTKLRIKLSLQLFPFFNPQFNSYDAAARHRSFDSMSAILSWLIGLTKTTYADFTLQDKIALEIGAGKFLTHAVGLHVCGCKEVISIDKYRQADIQLLRYAMQKRVLARKFFSHVMPLTRIMHRLKSIQESQLTFKSLEKLGIYYRAPVDFIETNEYDNVIDFIFTYTVLEHVPEAEIEQLISKMVTALKPGGVCTHYVDLEDHKNPVNNPFYFLGEQREWQASDCYSRGNRLRFSTWKKMFEKFDTMAWSFPHINQRSDVDLPEKLHESIKFNDTDDLSITGFVVIGKKL